MGCKYKSFGAGKYKYKVTQRNPKTKRFTTVGVVWADSIVGAKIIAGRDFSGVINVSKW